MSSFLLTPCSNVSTARNTSSEQECSFPAVWTDGEQSSRRRLFRRSGQGLGGSDSEASECVLPQ